jgi:hypothetical protein
MRYFYAVTLLLLIWHADSLAQSIRIRGKVRSNVDSAIAGASVVIKGTAIATLTNKNGEFSIPVPNLPATLVFSYIGYSTKELVLTKSTDSAAYIFINLAPLEYELEEVVVAGIGTSKRRGRSGARHSHNYVATTASTHAKRHARSGVLTAGELSDFKKWTLWEGYTRSEFKEWSEHWGIAPVNRYCVQVQNDDHKGIAGEKVFLIDLHTQDTVWRAITDNTGKAELWANYRVADSAQHTYALVCGMQIDRSPVTFENGINHLTLKRDCAPSGIADIAFVVDATGSMRDEIKYLQEELRDVIAKTAASNKGLNLRIGAVFYRDHNDDYLTRSLDFQNNPAPLIDFIKQQAASGGGDFPEAVDDALTTALDSLHWDAGARAKILFLVLDAPPHDEAKEKMEMLMVRAAAMGIRIVTVVCSGIDKSTEYLMRSLALTTNGSYVFLTDDSGVGDKHLKPTTDNFKVELLNDLLQRLIAEMVYMDPCNNNEKAAAPANQDKNIARIVVYPNPTSGRIRISTSEKIKELFITDFTGKVLENIHMPSGNQEWQTDLSHYPSGVYLIRYFIEQKGWGAEKVLVVK